MVTAGIFMITEIKLFIWFSSDVQNIIAIVGAVTSLVAATIALVQTDIKKKSTSLLYCISIRLMFLALGLGAMSSRFTLSHTLSLKLVCS
jgi:NADH-quinone oxidoreductase subunit L